MSYNSGFQDLCLSLTYLQNPEQFSDYFDLTTTIPKKNLTENNQERSWMPQKMNKLKIILAVPAINLDLLLGNAAQAQSFWNHPKLNTHWLRPKTLKAHKNHKFALEKPSFVSEQIIELLSSGYRGQPVRGSSYHSVGGS